MIHDKLFERILLNLKQSGATFSDSFSGVGGAQELEEINFSLDETDFILARETYIGFTFSGPADQAKDLTYNLLPKL
jgi:hypothetical protein